MRLTQPLERGRLVQRYKRFLADVALDDGGRVTAHCPNPGRMLGLDAPGLEVWLSSSAKPTRKLRHTLEMVRVDGHLVGVNTGHPNRLALEAIQAGLVPELQGYSSLRREVPYGANSRIDLLLEDAARPPCWVEVKNVHLKVGAEARFPDCPTRRGVKHLGELKKRVEAGERAIIFYVVQRSDCARFALADDIDPAYARACREAVAAGVEAQCWECSLDLDEITLARALPVVI